MVRAPQVLKQHCLVRASIKLQLPISGVSEKFKVTRAREVMMYHDYSDVKAASAGILVITGRKWQAQEAVNSGATAAAQYLSGLRGSGADRTELFPQTVLRQSPW